MALIFCSVWAIMPAEPGLFRLKTDYTAEGSDIVPKSCKGEVRFILVCEISNIYKKKGKTRKNHNLVFLPDLESAERFNRKLEKIGNIQSDGRPILGLDAKHLVEIVLETNSDGFLVPAHIWTPWFSLFGSKSGFDSLEECFEDFTPYIFAVETGLSSDPPMNWRISALDGITLISNSDAHSPRNLGREANRFDSELSYFEIRRVLESGDRNRFLGTLEFYPEEGKYHLDGHRKCKARLWPKETIDNGGLCPVCGKPVTLGVLYRVEELADREASHRPKKSHSYSNLIPLAEILSEILEVGPNTKKVQSAYRSLLDRFGPELHILQNIDTDCLIKDDNPMLGEAVKRMRQGRIHLSPGYDGEYGRVSLFDPSEKRSLARQRLLFVEATIHPDPLIPVLDLKRDRQTASCKDHPPLVADRSALSTSPAQGLNKEQKRAVERINVPMIILAGPGTGKTLTLTHRIFNLITLRKVPPDDILAVTFTRKAAEEMRQRLTSMCGNQAELPMITTFHGFCLALLKETANYRSPMLVDEMEKKQWIDLSIKMLPRRIKRDNAVPRRTVIKEIENAKQQLLSPEGLLQQRSRDQNHGYIGAVYHRYQRLLQSQNLMDYEDLIIELNRKLEADKAFDHTCRERFSHILVDEYQDLNYGQYRLIRKLSPLGRNLFVIGDPDQSIYGFRGSNSIFFERFFKDYPDAVQIHLKRNYRSVEAILGASHQVISAGKTTNFIRKRVYSGLKGIDTVSVFATRSEKAEAVAVGKTIEQMVGGTGFHFHDFDKLYEKCIEERNRSFSDIAVLFRTHTHGAYLADVFGQAGIPFQISDKRRKMGTGGKSILLSFLKITAGSGTYPDLQNVAGYTSVSLKPKTLDIFTRWALERDLPFQESLSAIKRFPVPGMNRGDQAKVIEIAMELDRLKLRLIGAPVFRRIEMIKDRYEKSISKSHPNVKQEVQTWLSSIQDANPNLSEWIEKTSLLSDIDFFDDRVEKVALLSMHSAKGLEFPVVFIVGCEDENIPLHPPSGEKTDIEEERRLFYVAMTRAREQLILTYAEKRRLYGKTLQRSPSPFLQDIEHHLKNHSSSVPPKSPRTKGSQKQLQLF